MKETGVSRRIDELGRIVIPKEIRKNLKIREGDQLEFYVEKEYVVLRKKSSLHGLNEDIIHLLEILNDKLKKDIILTISCNHNYKADISRRGRITFVFLNYELRIKSEVLLCIYATKSPHI